MSNRKGIPAAAYLRMSSDKQETSIDDQRREVGEYAAKRGFAIVRWYVDEGISGWKGKQRHAFQSLVTDAQEGEFRAVLCWDQSRFSRFDPMEANYYWHILRTADVFIETVKEGRLDFETLGGWLAASVQQHGKAEYVRSLAHDVVRGRRKQILAGKWITCPPYGYKLENGRLVLGDAIEVETVRKIFQLRAKGTGQRAICVALREAGVPSRRSQYWSPRHIYEILRRETYLGHTVVGKFPTGKFAHIVDERQRFENTHPAIIDRALWDAVQKVNNQRKHRGPGKLNYGGKPGAPLAGLLFCGKCGRRLYSEKTDQIYVCATYHSGGGCSYNCVSYDVALKIVADKIREVVLRGSVDKLEAEIERALARRKSSKATTAAATLKKQIGEIDKKLSAAAERIVEVEADLVKDVRGVMMSLKEKRQALVDRLDAIQVDKRKPKSAREIAAGLWKLDDVLRNGDPLTIKTALTQMIDRIEIEFTPLGKTKLGRIEKRPRYRPTGGTIFLSSIEDTSSRISSPNWTLCKTRQIPLSKADFAAVG